MSTNRNEHLRYRYGLCLNDNCEKCKAKEVQQVLARKDFVCEKCEKPLRECPPPKAFRQKYGNLIGIFVAVAAIAGIVAGYIFFTPNENTREDTLIINDSIAKGEKLLNVEEEVSDSASSYAVTDDLTSKAFADSLAQLKADSIVAANRNAESEHSTRDKSVKGMDNKVTSTSSNIPSSPLKKTSSSNNLSYGTWTGKMKNGQPHGTGTMTYLTQRTIDSRDSKERVAQPGEYIVGEWDNGHLVQGRWFKNDGSKEAIIIGKAG